MSNFLACSKDEFERLKGNTVAAKCIMCNAGIVVPAFPSFGKFPLCQTCEEQLKVKETRPVLPQYLWDALSRRTAIVTSMAESSRPHEPFHARITDVFRHNGNESLAHNPEQHYGIFGLLTPGRKMQWKRRREIELNRRMRRRERDNVQLRGQSMEQMSPEPFDSLPIRS